jgi:hypothetical protein
MCFVDFILLGYIGVVVLCEGCVREDHRVYENI